MTSHLMKFLLMVLGTVSVVHARGILEALKNEVPVVVPDYDPSGPVLQNDPRIMATLEKPPVNFATTGAGEEGHPGADPSTPSKVIGHTCHSFKTVLRPVIVRQVVTVPYLQRYVRYVQVPVIETYHSQQEIPY
ncbi:hypothetical protein RUM44_007028 [Polyplax serrata]|uniref:Uncharacterized protein n=1 Tax=Polyplax serrata TaxID=468196 RepID=A0ABR1AZJ7_POLSC